MGRHEEFLYSNKYTPEQIAKALIRNETSIELNDNSVDVICKATAVRNININKIRIFGVTEEIEPIKISEGITGLIVSCPNSKLNMHLPIALRMRTKSVPIDNVIFNVTRETDIGHSYADYFADSSIEVNGKIYFAELKPNTEKSKKMSINEQAKMAKKEKTEKKEDKQIPKVEKGIER